MYVILWEFLVEAEHAQEFETCYGATGAWTNLFRKQDGYLGTELLRDPANPQRYITIDRWNSPSDHESFVSKWKAEYEALDLQCARLIRQETLLGKWEAIADSDR